jgi:hypothetical protein
MGLRHAFTNPQADDGDSTHTRPSDWNAKHIGNVPEIVQVKTASTQVNSITLDSTPVSGHSIILVLDGYNTGQATAVSSTNTTWTQIKTFGPSSGSQYAAIWIGKASGSAGTAISVTHPNSFMSMAALEIPDSLTPTAGTSNAASFPNVVTPLKLNATTENHLIIAAGGVDNTTLANRISMSVPSSGLPYNIVSVIVGYSQGYPVYATSDSGNGSALMIVEVT